MLAGSMDHYFENLTDLIESVSTRYKAPVILISHSMGGPTLQAFLNRTTQDWKDRYISAWFPVEGVWAGAPKVTKAVISGDNFGTPAPSDDLIAMERTLESPIFLLPLAQLWPKNHSDIVFVHKPRKVYNVHMFAELLEDLNVTNAEERVDPILEKRLSLRAPGVKVFCIYGTNVSTPWGYEYSAFDGSDPTKTVLGDGDGTVPLHSLELCSDWSEQQTQTVRVETFPGVEHVKAIMNPGIFNYIHSQIIQLEKEFDGFR